jgi:hypothetical protein
MQASNALAVSLLAASTTFVIACTAMQQQQRAQQPTANETAESSVSPSKTNSTATASERAPAAHESQSDEVKKQDPASVRDRILIAQSAVKDVSTWIKRKDADKSELELAEGKLAALQAALGDASRVEGGDAAFMKVVAAARKDADVAKKTIEQRKLDMVVEDSRQSIAHVVAELGAAMKRIHAKNPEDEDFTQARTVVDDVQKALAKAEGLSSKDARFQKYVAQVKDRLEADKKLIEQRQSDVTIQRQRSRVEMGRKMLADALDRLRDKNVTDAQFEEADAAIKSIAKTLEDGAALKAKDKDYASYAVQVTLRIKEAASRVESRRGEVAVSRQKTEIEAAKSILKDGMRNLAGRDVAEGEFEAARAAVAGVQKTLEAALPLAAKDKDLARYVDESKKALESTRAAIDKRKLEVDTEHQRAQVGAALATVKETSGHLKEETDCQQAEAAVVELEKVLESGQKLGSTDARYAAFAGEAKKTATASRKKIEERRDQIAIDGQKAKVEEALETMKGAMAALEGPAPADGQFHAAAEAIGVVRKVLESGAELERKMPKYDAYASAVKKSLRAAEQQAEKRKLDLAVAERRKAVEDAIAQVKNGVEATKNADARSEQVKGATAAFAAAREELSKGAPLEAKDKSYLDFALKQRNELAKLREDLDEARQRVSFREGPLAEVSEGLRLEGSAGGGLSDDALEKVYANALQQFRTCRKDGASLLSDHPRLISAAFVVEGKKTTGANVLSLCAEHVKVAEVKLSAVKTTLAFYNGPAKSFEKGKALADKIGGLSDESEKKRAMHEALSQFEACLESGRILEHQHPELAKEQFDVAGGKMTLPAIIESCHKQAKSLRGKGGSS